MSTSMQTSSTSTSALTVYSSNMYSYKQQVLHLCLWQAVLWWNFLHPVSLNEWYNFLYISVYYIRLWKSEIYCFYASAAGTLCFHLVHPIVSPPQYLSRANISLACHAGHRQASHDGHRPARFPCGQSIPVSTWACSQADKSISMEKWNSLQGGQVRYTSIDCRQCYSCLV